VEASGATRPEYESTRLWLESLGPETDATDTGDRERLRAELDGARIRALAIAQRIQSDLPDFTVHDANHLDALWLLAEEIGGERLTFNPAEAFVFGIAVLLHDLGLAVAAYPGGIDELRNSTEWRDALGFELRKKLGRAPNEEETVSAGEDLVSAADRTVLRERHASQAFSVSQVALGDGDEKEYLLADPALRRIFGHLAGQLAASHWWPVPELRRFAETFLAAAELPGEWKVDALKLACLLRLADYSHLDSRRAPELRRLVQQPRDESLLHWDMQERLARPTVAGTRLRYQSTRPFGRDESEAWWLAFDMLSAVDEEMRQVDSLLQDLGRETFALNGVVGAGDPGRFRESIETGGWEPVDAQLNVSDVTALVRKLGGSNLYGKDPLVPLRETIQNGRDAVLARQALNPGWPGGSVVVSLIELDEEWLQVEVADDGIGMTQEILSGPLLDFGRSLWRESRLRQLIPGLAASGFEPAGRFGIGFFSVFMWNRPVRVRSRFYLSATADTFVLEFPQGLSRRALVRRASQQEQLMEPGTVVVFNIRDATGKNERRLRNEADVLLGRLCPTLAVDLLLAEDLGHRRIVAGEDWPELDPTTLLQRIGSQPEAPEASRVRPLFDANGEMVGRAVAVQPVLYLGSDLPGAVTVGGLEARRGGGFKGVLLGDRPNLARSDARPLVSSDEVARWASEQAELWSGERDRLGEGGIRLADSLLRCGGDIAGLPVCYGVDGPMDRESLRNWAAEREEVLLWPEIDTDELRVPGGWDPTFTPGPDTIVIGAGIGTSDLTKVVDVAQDAPGSLEPLVREAIARAWGVNVEDLLAGSSYSDGRVVGHSEEGDIESATAEVFSREAAEEARQSAEEDESLRSVEVEE
jgi:hypothetical protein